MADLLSKLGFDPDAPDVAESREDVRALMDLVDQLVALRLDADLRQKDVAERMETTQSAISEFERLGGDPRVSTVQRYARAVGTCLRLNIAHQAADGVWKTVWSSNQADEPALTPTASTWTDAASVVEVPRQPRMKYSNLNFATAA